MRLIHGNLLLALGASVFAQAPGVPIEEQIPISRNEQILASAQKLRESGSLLSNEKVAAQLTSPTGGKIDLVEQQNRPLTGRDVAKRAREAYTRIGWYYRCTKCDKWHLDFSGGYAIAPDALVTCHHCLSPRPDMREAFLIALNRQNEVLPITEIIASSAQLDCVILRTKGSGLSPLALRDDVAPGDRVSCFSEPLGQQGYFSNGIINRFYWKSGRSSKEGSLEQLESLRVNVSTDWAPGSSGAAVIDEYGNAIGHVSRIAPLAPTGRMANAVVPERLKDAVAVGDEKPKKAAAPKPESVVITLHEAIPARSVRALAIEAGKASAKGEEKPTTPKEPAAQ
jgi:hypothetical protein